jgi:hypothetical protein
MAFPVGYSKYQEITIDNTKVMETLTDYPFYIDLSDLDVTLDIFNTVRTDGGDIRVTLSDGVTQLAREVVSIDTTLKTGELHIKIPSLPSSTDTIIRVWYNGVDIEPSPSSAFGSQNVWASNYEMVQHMNEDPSGTAPQMLDSTANALHGTSSGSMTSGDLVAGKIGKAIDFDGTDDMVDMGNVSIVDGLGNVTFSAWVNTDNVTKCQGVLDEGDVVLYLRICVGEIRFQVVTGSGVGFAGWSFSPTVISGDHLFSGTYDGSTVRTYWDGVERANSAHTGTLTPNAGVLEIGDLNGNFMDGRIDECRISTDTKTPLWMLTEFNNQD